MHPLLNGIAAHITPQDEDTWPTETELLILPWPFFIIDRYLDGIRKEQKSDLYRKIRRIESTLRN
jgi:hypothetical protein